MLRPQGKSLSCNQHRRRCLSGMFLKGKRLTKFCRSWQPWISRLCQYLSIWHTFSSPWILLWMERQSVLWRTCLQLGIPPKFRNKWSREAALMRLRSIQGYLCWSPCMPPGRWAITTTWQVVWIAAHIRLSHIFAHSKWKEKKESPERTCAYW